MIVAVPYVVPPVTTPVVDTTEAVPTALLLQVPPVTASVRFVVKPEHTSVTPFIAVGAVLTVITFVT